MAVYLNLSDITNNSVTKNCGTIRMVQVDTAGAVLATGTDCMGQAYGSIYELGNIEDVKWNNMGSIQTKIDLNGRSCALAFNEGEKTLEFNIIGLYNKYATGPILTTIEKAIKSLKPFKMCWYNKVDAVADLWVKYVWYQAYFDPNYSFTRKQGEFTIIPVKVNFMDLESPTYPDVNGVLGNSGKTLNVSSILALGATETFEAQTETSL